MRGQGVGLVIVALLNGVQISANNASLGEMELSMNQVRTYRVLMHVGRWSSA